MKKTAGRPKIVVDIPKIVELTNAGLGARAIAKELGVSPSVVHRAQKAAQNENVLAGVDRGCRKTVAETVAMTTVLDRRDRAIVVYALGVAIEKEIGALEFCCQQLHGGSAAVGEAILERQRALKELGRTRQRLLHQRSSAP